jgi:hypothetical protein
MNNHDGVVTHGLYTNEGETSVDEGTDETKEVSSRSSDAGIIGPRSRIGPISEAYTVVVGSASQCDDQADED